MTAAAETAQPTVQYYETKRLVVPYKVFDENSSGTPLILEHGISAGVDDWPIDFVNLIDAPVIAVGIPGPDHTPEYPTFGHYAGATSQTVESIIGENEQFDVLALSWSGGVAQKLALINGNVRRMVLAATLPAAWPSLMNVPNWHAAIAIARAKRGNVDPAKVYGGDFRTNPELAKKFAFLVNREIDEAHHMRQQRALLLDFGMLVAENIVQFRRPETLFMGGTDDPLIRWRIAKFSAWLLGMDIHKVKDGGHAFLFTRPVDSAITINEFLSRKPRR